ncbi:MAG TPA: hypothetical protein VFT64_06975 [Rickettsiales bacterium]|nr:hypothetical protein [Rickettsiales bacterium]
MSEPPLDPADAGQMLYDLALAIYTDERNYNPLYTRESRLAMLADLIEITPYSELQRTRRAIPLYDTVKNTLEYLGQETEDPQELQTLASLHALLGAKRIGSSNPTRSR